MRRVITLLLPVVVAFLLCLTIGCGANDSSYQSTPDELDTSEESRRRVTDKMIEDGSDPTDAEAFTSELYKAQREWEAKNK
jgi:hypothetical protein